MNQLLCGDALTVLRTLPDAAVHCVVTSPPYWGLRDYGVSGQLGLEDTPEEYLAKMVEVFREVRRVLRRDGVAFVNMGDAYRGKQLLGMPWRLALALQADDWYLRSAIVWHKPAPQPESVIDRPTTSHEHVFLLSQRPRYFYDAEAIKEPVLDATIARLGQPGFEAQTGGPKDPKTGNRSERRTLEHLNERYSKEGVWVDRHKEYAETARPTRNARTVWTIATEPFSGDHFAAFPTELARRCIAAGTSLRGCCAACGAPWRRIVQHTTTVMKLSERGEAKRAAGLRRATDGTMIAPAETVTLGWERTCRHEGDPVPCVVLDPFVGSGTVALVASRMGREYIGIDINPKYIEMTRRRLAAEMPLFTGEGEGDEHATSR